MRRSLVGAVTLTALLLLYMAAVASRAVSLLGSGEPVGVALGAAVLVLPLVAVWLLVREWRLAVTVQRMADHLASVGELAVDTLPRSPAGRIDRAAADRAFASAQAGVEAAPADWSAWFRLGFAYDAAGDRRRAREALRTAARLRAQP